MFSTFNAVNPHTDKPQNKTIWLILCRSPSWSTSLTNEGSDAVLMRACRVVWLWEVYGRSFESCGLRNETSAGWVGSHRILSEHTEILPCCLSCSWADFCIVAVLVFLLGEAAVTRECCCHGGGMLGLQQCLSCQSNVYTNATMQKSTASQWNNQCYSLPQQVISVGQLVSAAV